MRVRLMKRKGKKGTTLFLRWWNNADKKYVHEFMKFRLSNDLNRREEDKELLRQAELKRIDKEQKLTSQTYGIGHFNKRRTPFINYLDSVKKGKGWNSVLHHLKDFEGKNMPVCDIDENWLKDFRNFLVSRPKVQKSSANRYYAITKACLNIAYKEKLLSRNPSREVEPISAPSKPVHSLTEREVRMFAKEKPLTTTLKAFLFSVCTGLRYSDLKTLKLNEIDLEKRQILKTQVKTGRVVGVPLTEEAFELIKENLEQANERRFEDKTNPDRELIFPDLGNPQQVNKELKKKANILIEKRVHFHLARATFASLVYEKTNDIYAVSKLLGHRHVATTQKYLNVSTNKLREVVEESIGSIGLFE
jgi:site-specific recombinase XerD